MFTFINNRLKGRQVGRTLRRSIYTQPGRWKIDPGENGEATVVDREFRIVLEPCFPRVLDAIHVYCDEAEIWLPLWPRLRLRSAVRWLLLRHAADRLPERKNLHRRKADRRALANGGQAA